MVKPTPFVYSNDKYNSHIVRRYLSDVERMQKVLDLWEKSFERDKRNPKNN